MNWRQRLGAFIGGFDAGQHHRRLRGFQATRAHVNALIAASGPDITARARWLVRNNGYAMNAVESWAANTVGDGIKPISKLTDAARKEELQQLWLAWTDEADAEGLTDFYGLQRRAAREVFLAGEVFVRIRPRRVEDGLMVTEIAPGIDLKRDVLDQAATPLLVAPDLKVMDARLFTPDLMGLAL
jgi:capsid protein